jgi:hypothetical protein
MADKVNAHKSWMKLDNAAKIYPAAKRRNWKALFRLSATLTEKIDPAVLEQAQRSTLARFPGFALKLKRGVFWYYMEHNEGEPAIGSDGAYPCAPMDFKENSGFMFRVRYHERRIAVEIFHALTDGSGGLCFLKTLVAEYLRIKYGAQIPRDNGILDCTLPPSPDETEDAYLKYARNIARSRRESDAYYLKGTDEPDGFAHIVTALIPADAVLRRAKEKQVSLTEYLAAALIIAIDKLQRRAIRYERQYRPVKVCIPINLRRFYPTNTMRNFASYVNPGINPCHGVYSFDEVLSAVHHYMRSEVTEKLLNAKMSTNVRSEMRKVMRLTPLFLKNIAMKFAFYRVGDRKSTTTISNLGEVRLPDEMARFVTRMDFILGPLSRNKVVCGALSYNGVLTLNFMRTIKESALEREFLRYLVKLGIPVKVESNGRW